jgi:hypothetical protein
MLFTEWALSSLSTNLPFHASIPHETKFAGRLKLKQDDACLSCYLQCCQAQGCGQVGGSLLKSKLLNQYVIIFDCRREHADHVIVGTLGIVNIMV